MEKESLISSRREVIRYKCVGENEKSKLYAQLDIAGLSYYPSFRPFLNI